MIALYWDWDFPAAGTTLERAVAQSPNNTNVHHYYADYLMVTGKVQESLEQVRIGRSYDPLWPIAHGIVLHHALWARRYDEVIAEGRRLLEAFPDARAAHDPMGHALWLQGKHAEALTEWRAGAGPEDDALRVMEAAYRSDGPFAALAARGEWAARQARHRPVHAFEVASWFAAAGEADRAFEWLERSQSRREPQLLHVVPDPRFDPIRADPRFEALMRRIGVPRSPVR